MLKNQIQRLKKQSIKSKKPTAICKICFETIKPTNLGFFIGKNPVLCANCMEKLKPCFSHFKVGDTPCLAIYNYDEELRSLIYQFKGCFDYELKDIFINRYALILSFIYYGYYIIPVPSYFEDDSAREFNHVQAIFSCLKNKMIFAVSKIDKYKQSDQSKDERHNIIKHLKMSHLEEIKNKKILIVDDVFTTGNTIRSMIDIIKKGDPKKIKVLVLSKVTEKGE